MFGKKDKDTTSSGGVSGFLGKLCSTGATDKHEEHNMDASNTTSASTVNRTPNENVVRSENVSGTAPLSSTAVHHGVVDSSNVVRSHNPTVTTINQTPGQYDVADQRDVKSGNYEYDDKNKELRTYEKEYGRNKNNLGNYENLPSGEVRESIKDTTYVRDRPLLNERERMNVVEPNLHSSNIPSSHLHSSNISSSNISSSNMPSSNVHSANIPSNLNADSKPFHNNRDMGTLGVDRLNLGSANLYPTGSMGIVSDRDHVKEYVHNYDKDYFANGARLDDHSKIPITRVNDSANLPSSNVIRGSSVDDLLEYNRRVRDEHERQYELERNRLREEYEREFMREKELMKRKHEEELEAELKAIHKMEYDKEKNQLKEEFERDLERRRQEIRDRHDQLYSRDIDGLKNRYDSKFEEELNRLKQRNFEKFEEEKLRLQQKYKELYERERDTIVGRFSNIVDKDKAELKSKHEQDLQNELSKLQSDFDRQFEMERERLKQQYESTFEREKLGLKEDYAKMVIEDKGHQGINMKIHDNTTLPKKNIVTTLKEKIIDLGGHDTFDIKGKDWYEGNTETYVREGPTTTYSSSSVHPSGLSSEQAHSQTRSEWSSNYSDSTLSKPMTGASNDMNMKNEHLSTSNVAPFSDRNKYVHHDA